MLRKQVGTYADDADMRGPSAKERRRKLIFI